MTPAGPNPKLTPDRLARRAIVYLRQSSERQVQQNLESQRLQYALVDRARALGWTQVEVIDTDSGWSAAMGAAPREGFARLLASVALGEVSLVLSREVSRLARTDKDWCHLLEVCQLFDTLIDDAEQVYDVNPPASSRARAVLCYGTDRPWVFPTCQPAWPGQPDAARKSNVSWTRGQRSS